MRRAKGIFALSNQLLRRSQEGCGGLGGENPGAFPKAGPIFQQPLSLPESAQTLAGIAFRAAGKSGNGRGRDEAEISEEKRLHSLNEDEAFSE